MHKAVRIPCILAAVLATTAGSASADGFCANLEPLIEEATNGFGSFRDALDPDDPDNPENPLAWLRPDSCWVHGVPAEQSYYVCEWYLPEDARGAYALHTALSELLASCEFLTLTSGPADGLTRLEATDRPVGIEVIHSPMQPVPGNRYELRSNVGLIVSGRPAD